MTRPGPKTIVFLLLTASIAGLAVAWDWNWFRGPLERHLSEQSGRAVRIGGLDVSFPRGLDPTVRLRDLHIDNAGWARATAGHPFAKAGEVAFTFAWRSLLERRPVVSHLLLVDADVSLERHADGLRNWRLRDPDDRGPGKFKFLRLEAHQSRLRFVHEGIGLDVKTAATDLPAGAAPLATRIAFEGTWRDGPFTGSADTSRVLTFLETGEAFSLRGHGQSGKTRLDADGQVTDLFKLDAVEADLALSGPSLADVRRLLPQAWPETAAYTLRAHLSKATDQWHFTDLRADVGKSDVGGEVRYNGHGDRPYLEATLTSRTTRIEDVWPDRAAAAPSKGGKTGDDTPPLRDFDGEVTLLVRSLHVADVPPLTQVRVKAQLDDGLLDLSPVQVQLAGGQAQGLAVYDTRQKPATLRAELAWRNLRLEQLLPPLPDDGEATGPISGDLKLTSRGATADALLGNATGRVSALLKGGRLSAGLDARLALNGGKLLRAAVGDPPDVPILCARAEMTVKDGHGEVFPLLLDTAQTRVDGRGRIDLVKRHVDLLLSPNPKQTAPLALSRSLHVTGTPAKFDVALVKLESIEPQVSCDAPPAVKAR
ncbi:MAG: AsmA family protein [Rhizobacter sp.]